MKLHPIWNILSLFPLGIFVLLIPTMVYLTIFNTIGFESEFLWLGMMTYYSESEIICQCFIASHLCSPIGILIIIFGIRVYIYEIDDYNDYKHRYDNDIKYLRETINELNEKIENINPLKNHSSTQIDVILKHLTSKTRKSRNEIIQNSNDFNEPEINPCIYCINFNNHIFDYETIDCNFCKWSETPNYSFPCNACYNRKDFNYPKFSPKISCETCKHIRG